MTIYNSANAPMNPNEYPAILAIGDSWFWYPANNILEAIAAHPRLKDPFRHMVRIGQNGALMIDYVDLPGRPGKYAKTFADELKPINLQYYSAVFISGAGNDSVDYKLGLNTDCTGFTTVDQCVSADGLQRLITDVTRNLSILMHEVLSAFHGVGRNPVVVMHGYDYALPDGRGFDLLGIPVTGPWLSKAMDDCRVPADWALRCAIVRRLIDRLNTAFGQYDQPNNDIYFVDSRGVLSGGADYKDDWVNELHPTRKGFDKIVDQKWIPILKKARMAK